MDDETEQLSKDLQTLGLSKNESQVLIALTKLGNAEASRIAEASRVPQNKIYQIMRQLEEKNIILTEPVKGGANYYTLLHTPVQAIDHLQEGVLSPVEEASKRAQHELTEILNILSDEEPIQQEMWTVRGNHQIIQTVEDMIKNAQKFIITNFRPEYLLQITSALEKAKQRGLAIHLLMRRDELETIKNKEKVDIDLIANEVLAGDFNMLKDDVSKFSPFIEGGSIFPQMMENFNSIILNRPNMIVVDPNLDTRGSLIAVRSKDNSLGGVGIVFINEDLINFQMTILGIVRDLVSHFATK